MIPRTLRVVACCAGLLLAITSCRKKETAPAAPAAPAGQTLYKARCAFCHGADGKGNPGMAANSPAVNVADADWTYSGSKEDIARVISDGIPDTRMRGFKGTMTSQEIDAVAEYVLSFATGP